MNFETLEPRCMLAGVTDSVLDRMVDIRDNFGQQVEVGTRGDFDRSGTVDFKDFLVVANDLTILNVPVKWSIPDNEVVANGIAKLSIRVENKNGKFADTCTVLLGDEKTTNTHCKIVVDATDLQVDDDPWVVTVGFKKQIISLDPPLRIATVNIERLIDPALLLQVNSKNVQLGVVSFREISVR